MQLTTGRIIFAVLFFIAFVVLMFFAYKKDSKVTAKHYKGIYKLFVIILVIFSSYFILVRLLK